VRLLEARTFDLLFRYSLGDAPQPSADIVHVDIDDGALDSVGRWPWPRSRLAEAIAAIDGYGARVIVLDLLLDEAQEPEYRPDGTRVDHDAALAAAIAGAKARVILSARTDERATRVGSLWTEGEGPERLRAVVAALRKDITRDADDVIRETGLDEERAQRVRARLRDFKRLAVSETVEEMRKSGAVAEEALRGALLPAERAHLEDFPERRLLLDAVDHVRALDAIQARLPRFSAPFPIPRADDIRTPLPLLAAAADGVGLVDAFQDADGVLRRVRARWEHGGRVHFQLGLVGAAAWLDVPLADLRLERDAITVGRTRLPLARDELILAWPGFDRERGIASLAPHVSIGAVLAVGKARAALDALVARRLAVSRKLVAEFLPSRRPEELDDPASAVAVEEELQEEVAFTLEGIEKVPEAERTEKDRACLAWVRQGREIADARVRIGSRDRELRAAIAGRLAFVGWNATGALSDFYPTVVSGRTPGVVAHAIVANSCLTGYVLREAPLATGFLIVVVLALLAGLLSTWLGPRLAILLALLAGLVYASGNILLVFAGRRTELALATPLLGIFVPLAGATVARAVRERLERARLTKQFGQRISKGLFDFLLEHPDVIHLEGVEREVTSFFSDLAGFTAISESLDSRRTVALLNRYMFAMNEVLQRHFAYVNKFLGDGIMAVWGAFDPDTPHAERACRAALACMRRLEELRREPDFADCPPISMRIGIATGVVTVGDCGAPPDLRDYTVIGDSVNLAARLESANKQFGTRMLVNGRTRELLPPEILVRPIGRATVVGQEIPNDLFELMAIRGEEGPGVRERIAATEKAVGLFRERRLDEARAAFAEVGRHPGDGKLAHLYLEAIEAHLEDPSAPFDGVLRLSSK